LGFYGMLLGLTLVLAAVLSSAILYRMSILGGLSTDFNTYSNMQKIEAFASIVENTRVPASSTLHGSWLNQIYASAAIDGININVSGNVTVLSTRSKPAVYAVLGNI